MTKTEAITEMLKGSKVTHENFSHEEWITINGKMDNSNQHKYLLEDGVQCGEMEFWLYRQGKEWYTGWSLWEKAYVPPTGEEQDRERRQRGGFFQ